MPGANAMAAGTAVAARLRGAAQTVGIGREEGTGAGMRWHERGRARERESGADARWPGPPRQARQPAAHRHALARAASGLADRGARNHPRAPAGQRCAWSMPVRTGRLRRPGPRTRRRRVAPASQPHSGRNNLHPAVTIPSKAMAHVPGIGAAQHTPSPARVCRALIAPPAARRARRAHHTTAVEVRMPWGDEGGRFFLLEFFSWSSCMEVFLQKGGVPSKRGRGAVEAV